MNKTVFCEFSFLKDFLRSCPKHGDDPLAYDPVMSWMKLYQFLCTSKTYVDVAKSRFVQESLSDALLMKFYKRCPNLWFCDRGFSFNDVAKNGLNDEMMHSVYLSSHNKRDRAELSKSLGIIVLGKQDITQFEILFGERTIAIPHGSKFKSWEDVDFPEYAKVSNSLIIVDNYVTKYNNIIGILDVLLPEKLTYDFYLSIYTMPPAEQEKCQCKDLIRRIRELRNTKLLNIKLVVCKAYTGDFHDRIIISNNMWIDCGGGFDLFKNGISTKRTNLRFAFPFMMNAANHKSWENEAYYYLIKDLIEMEKPEKSHTYGKDFWGKSTRENRLLTYYNKIIKNV